MVKFAGQMLAKGDAECIHVAIGGGEPSDAAFVPEGLQSFVVPEIGLADERHRIEKENGRSFARADVALDGIDRAGILKLRTGARAEDADQNVGLIMLRANGGSMRGSAIRM